MASNPANRQKEPGLRGRRFVTGRRIFFRSRNYKKEQKLCTNMLERIEGLRMISEWSVVLSVSPRYSYLVVS